MCEALMEIMKKDIDKKVAEGEAKARAEGRAEGEAKGRIEESVQIYREELKMDDTAIITKIQEKFNLAPQIAKGYVLAEK